MIFIVVASLQTARDSFTASDFLAPATHASARGRPQRGMPAVCFVASLQTARGGRAAEMFQRSYSSARRARARYVFDQHSEKQNLTTHKHGFNGSTNCQNRRTSTPAREKQRGLGAPDCQRSPKDERPNQ